MVGPMRILPPLLDIGETEGFSPQKDIFKRAEFGRGLTKLISETDDPLIILLDSPWGTGKTTFLEMWAGELRTDGYPVILFDAFAHDHIDDAFLALAGELISLAKSKIAKDKSTAQKFLGIASKAGGILLRNATKIGVKAATLGAINAAELADELSDVASDIAGTASDTVDEYVKGILDRQADDKATLSRFREALSELATSLSPPKSDPYDHSIKSQKRPLIFILDELDRCRPPFALDILENIKHLFSVPNVHFILSANLHQLEVSVKYNYGQEIDARSYLQKFYNLSASFPEPERDPKIRKIYIDYLCRNFEIKNSSHERSDSIMEMMSYVSDAKNLPLRTIERIFANISISITMTPNDLLKLTPIVCGLCIMKVCNPEFFSMAKSGRLSMSEVDATLEFHKWPERNSRSADWVRKWWMFCLEKDLPVGEGYNWDQLEGSLFRYNIGSRTSLVPWTAQWVVEPLSVPE
ncbi:KAP family P-loop NTPase fold protein [Xanthobacter wiegelii]|uniref:KAP family P-loop NTPase fold protein n=1 Tax=Xanthobacter wiegelii TaxID=3119913 RepID=UPI00372B7022